MKHAGLVRFRACILLSFCCNPLSICQQLVSATPVSHQSSHAREWVSGVPFESVVTPKGELWTIPQAYVQDVSIEGLRLVCGFAEKPWAASQQTRSGRRTTFLREARFWQPHRPSIISWGQRELRAGIVAKCSCKARSLIGWCSFGVQPKTLTCARQVSTTLLERWLWQWIACSFFFVLCFSPLPAEVGPFDMLEAG